MLRAYKLLYLTFVLSGSSLVPFFLAHRVYGTGWLVLMMAALAGVLFSHYLSWIEFIQPYASH